MSTSFSADPGRTPSLPDLEAALRQLLPLLESLPAGSDWLDALKKRGAWHDKPLLQNNPPLLGSPAVPTPYYIKIDAEGCTIDLVNVSRAELLHDLERGPVTVDAYGNAVLSISAPASSPA